MSTTKSIRDGFGEAILEIAKKSSKIYVLSADLRDSLRVQEFSEKIPERFIECGVAEQNMMGIAAGLALENKIPFVTSFAVFNPGRNWDQLRVSVCLSNLPVKIIGGHAGLSNFKDGASHQALEDIAITRVLPNLKVLIPADYYQTKQLIYSTCNDKSPTYIRITAENPEILTKDINFEIGKAQVITEGDDLTIVTAGPLLNKVYNVVHKLNKSIEIINLHTVKPIDKETIIESVNKTKKILTIEDHQIYGGIGSSVAEIIAQSTKGVFLKIHGIKDKFSRSSRNAEELYKYFNLDEESILQIINSFIEE